MSNSSKIFDALNYGSAGVGVTAMVSSVILNQEIKPNHLYLYLLTGFVTFIIALYSTVNTEKKDPTDQNAISKNVIKSISNVAGIASAGYVLVYWSSYQSFLLSIVVLAIILVSVATTFVKKPENIVQSFGKIGVTLLFIVVVSGGIVSIWNVVTNNPQTLEVKVSPSEAYPSFQDPNLLTVRSSQNLVTTLDICSYNANALHFQLNATTSTPLLTAFLDNRTDEPVKDPLLIDSQDVYHTLRLESSPQITAGPYQVFLNYSYQDIYGKSFSGFKTLDVYVGQQLESVADTYLIPSVVGVFIMIVIVIAATILTRRRKP
jgi:hypothetical protein